MNLLEKILLRAPINRHSDFGLVIDWKFHKNNGWCCALSPYLIKALLKEFKPVIISSQEDYDQHKTSLKRLISVEPGWAAPRLKYDLSVDCLKAVFYSDPQQETERRRAYLDDNGFNYVFSYYKSPFFYHFKDFPEDRFVHMPWAIPDEFIGTEPITCNGDEVAIFGGKQAPSYNIRNWCREQDGVTNYENSGVENKTMSDKEFLEWLGGFDTIIAAGSDDPAFNMVTPKYFEIASSGSLLFGQKCNDLEELGFNDSNAVIFEKENFLEKLKKYKENPEAYLEIRKKGRELIRERHTVSQRIKKIKEVLYENSSSS